MTPVWVLFIAFLSAAGKEEPPAIIIMDSMMHCHKMMVETRKLPYVESANCKLTFVIRMAQ
jgi:hypothetical protein